MPIRWRLTIWYVSLLAALLIVFSGTVTIGLRYFMHQSLDNTLENQAALLTEAVDIENGEPTIGDRRIRNRPGRQFVRLVDQHGEQLTDSNPALAALPDEDPGLELALEGNPDVRWRTIEDDRLRVLSQPVLIDDEVVAVVQVGLSSRNIDSILSQTLLLVVTAGGFVLLLAVIGGVWLAGRTLHPIDRMTRLAARIGDQDLSQRIDTRSSDDELGRLARTFNAMLDRLEGAINRQRQFTAAASHELRTPLAMMQSQIELAMTRAHSAQQTEEMLETLHSDVNRLTRISNTLLTLARSDTGEMDLEIDDVGVHQLLELIAEQYAPLAESQGVQLTIDTEDVRLAGDEDRLIQLMVNLVDNALQHTPSGRSVILTCVREEERVRILVVDEGRGISSEDLPYIFERFYRASPSARSTNNGAGLGLSLSKMIVEAHKGTITVESTQGAGTAIIVDLPVAGPEP